MTFTRGLVTGAVLTATSIALIQRNMKEVSIRLQSSINTPASTPTPSTPPSLVQELLKKWIPADQIPKISFPKLPDFNLEPFVRSWNENIDRVAEYLLEKKDL
jgi:hypothetical protein